MPDMWAKISISPARRRASAPAACAPFRHELCCEPSGLDGEEEFIVYAAPVGTVRPEDTAQEAAFYQFIEDEDL